MLAPYRDLAELVLHTVQGQDYRIVVMDQGSEITVATIHGGRIEPLTSELAVSVAGEEYNLYDFRGTRGEGNEALRVLPNRFDEVRLRALMRRSRAALCVEGIPGADPVMQVGGRNRRLLSVLAARLRDAGFDLCPPTGAGAIHDPARFFNWPADGGVQIALTVAARQGMVDCPLERSLWENPRCWNDRFSAFVVAVRGAIEQYRADVDVALGRFEHDTVRVRRKLNMPPKEHPQ